MTTLEAYVKRGIDLFADETVLGRYVGLTSLTTTTAVAANALAFGGNSEQRYAQWWGWRPTTTTLADKIRQWDSFAPGTGTLIHSGTNYADTTATGETLFLCPPRMEPYKYRYAVAQAILQMREWDETIVPARRYTNGEYYLSDLPWLQDAASIREVRHRQSNILSRNRDFDKWHSIDTAGVLTPPDHWVLSGTGATVTRGTTNLFDGPHVATLTRNTNDATLLQSVGILPTGVSGDSLRGRTVTAVLRTRATVADRARVRIFENGTATASSSFHTGGSTYEVLTCSVTVASTTDTLTFGPSVEDGDTSVNLAQCFLIDGANVSDSDYRDDHWDGKLSQDQLRYEQGGPLKIHAPNIGFPAQFLICSERPYPGLDPARLASGDADQDESDAPLVPVATGMVAILLEGARHPDAEKWRQKFDALRLKHFAMPTDEGGGKTFVRPPLAAPARRVR